MRVLEQGIDRDEDIRSALDAGAPASDPQLEAAVLGIIAQVRQRGDEALMELGRKFDSDDLDALSVDPAELRRALLALPLELRSSMERAAENIRRFHVQEKAESWVSTRGGTSLGQLVRPLESVGVYVPGGRAAYPSTVLMTVIPAQVAGVPHVAVASPCGQGGRLPDSVMAACALCGVEKVYRVGGAQAIAAFAFGTHTIARVDKVVGPGNQYVNSAKRLLFGHLGIDSLAGPSEVLVIADETADPDWVAADLIAQAEHGGESRSVLVTWSRQLADRVLGAFSAQLADAPRAEYIRQSLGTSGLILLVRGADDAVYWSNVCAPEHLQLSVRDPQQWLGRLVNAGAIFVGPYSPVPLGDYAAGPSHTLPTGSAARFSSALGVAEFQKRTSLIWYGPDEYAEDARAGMVLAESEGLDAHRRCLEMRLKGGRT